MTRYAKMLTVICLLTPGMGLTDPGNDVPLPMWQKGSGGYYLHGVFDGDIESDMLIDTGSSYVVLTPETLAKLKKSGASEYIRTTRGATAAGRVIEVKVFSVSTLKLGEQCVLHNIEVIALPGADRDILGLSALRRLQPFAMQLEPAVLTVSACSSPGTAILATAIRP